MNQTSFQMLDFQNYLGSSVLCKDLKLPCISIYLLIPTVTCSYHVSDSVAIGNQRKIHKVGYYHMATSEDQIVEEILQVFLF